MAKVLRWGRLAGPWRRRPVARDGMAPPAGEGTAPRRPDRRGLRWPRAAALILLGLLPVDAAARVITVGEGAEFPVPSAAARVAAPGDIVRILPGTYYDCATWAADELVIEGSGAATVITDRVCAGKGLFVVTGANVTVRHLTLARARVIDANGAGIRAEGAGLTIESVVFADNQVAVMAGDAPDATVRIADTRFEVNGGTDPDHPHAALMVGRVARLSVADSVFVGGRGDAAIQSRADMTELARVRVDAPIPGRAASIVVWGALDIRDSRIEAAPGGREGPVAILARSGPAPGALSVSGSRLDGDGTLLLNWSARTVTLAGNALPAGGREHSAQGATLNLLGEAAREGIGTAEAAARDMVRWLIRQWRE